MKILYRNFFATFGAICTLSVGSLTQAQTTTQVSESASGVTSTTSPIINTGDFSPILKLESFNASGRKGDLEDRDSRPSGKTFQSKNELSAGVKHKSGWGAFTKIVRTSSAYNDTKRNKSLDVGDTSFTISHPIAVFDSGLKITGAIRQYIPDSEYSKKYTFYHSAYYLYLTGNLAPRWSLFNQVTPRFFNQPNNEYKADQTRFVFEDRTNLTYQLSDNFGVGLGQWTQFEKHNKTGDGYSVEAYPLIEYKPMKNISVGGKIMMPIFAQNVVYDGPKNSDLDNAWAELSLTVAL